MFTAKKIFFFIASFAITLAPYVVFAQWPSVLVPPTGSGLPSSTVGAIILNITNWILGFVVIFSVLAIIWGGVQYVTASGDESQTQEAKRIITDALFGLIIAGAAYAGVKVVVEQWIKVV